MNGEFIDLVRDYGSTNDLSPLAERSGVEGSEVDFGHFI
jgi:hypothetical protein